MNLSGPRPWPETCPPRGVAHRLSGVILDIDGTLVDSNRAHAQAWYDVLRAAGYDVSVDKLQRLIGMGSDKLLPAAVGVDKDSPEGQRLSDRRKQVFHDRYLPSLQPTPGARALLDRLQAEGLALAVASSAEGDELTALLAVCDAPELAQRTPPLDQVESSKPSPDVVQAALETLGQPAGEVLMLGDTPYDVEAATRAGIGSICVRCGGWGDAELKGARAIYDDPQDLVNRYSASPLAE